MIAWRPWIERNKSSSEVLIPCAIKLMLCHWLQQSARSPWATAKHWYRRYLSERDRQVSILKDQTWARASVCSPYRWDPAQQLRDQCHNFRWLKGPRSQAWKSSSMSRPCMRTSFNRSIRNWLSKTLCLGQIEPSLRVSRVQEWELRTIKLAYSHSPKAWLAVGNILRLLPSLTMLGARRVCKVEWALQLSAREVSKASQGRV